MAFLRKIAFRLLAAMVTLFIFGVGGEWFIRVADDKGWYANAGKTWDRIMGPVASFFDDFAAVVTSLPFVILMTASGGVVLGLWLERHIRRFALNSDASASESAVTQDEVKPDPELAILRSRLTKAQDDLAALFTTTDKLKGSLNKLQTAEEGTASQVAHGAERAKAQFALTAERITAILKVGADAKLAEMLLPTAEQLAKDALAETGRGPLPLSYHDLPIPHKKVGNEQLGEITERARRLRSQLLEQFSEEEVPPLWGHRNIMQLEKTAEVSSQLTGDDADYFRDEEHKLRWLKQVDLANGTSDRIQGLVSFLKAKQNLAWQLADLYRVDADRLKALD